MSVISLPVPVPDLLERVLRAWWERAEAAARDVDPDVARAVSATWTRLAAQARAARGRELFELAGTWFLEAADLEALAGEDAGTLRRGSYAPLAAAVAQAYRAAAEDLAGVLAGELRAGFAAA